MPDPRVPLSPTENIAPPPPVERSGHPAGKPGLAAPAPRDVLHGGDAIGCGMGAGGVAQPAGRSGMPGPIQSRAVRGAGVEQRVGEVQQRIAETGANRAGTAPKGVKRR
jgi:hypothetical protein